MAVSINSGRKNYNDRFNKYKMISLELSENYSQEGEINQILSTRD